MCVGGGSVKQKGDTIFITVILNKYFKYFKKLINLISHKYVKILMSINGR